MSTRVLASIRKILSIDIHPLSPTVQDQKKGPKTDLFIIKLKNIDDDSFSGWQCVTPMADFEDPQYWPYCVFIEYDSVLPQDVKEFEFMKSQKYLVKASKVYGVPSHGLVFPLTFLKNFQDDIDLEQYKQDGKNVMDLLKITKKPNEEEKNKNQLGPFPRMLCEQTDEVRIESLKTKFTELTNEEQKKLLKSVTITEKLDGTSCTIVFDEKGNIQHVCSRDKERFDKESFYCVMANRIENYLNENSDEKQIFVTEYCPCAIQGEIIGPKIQADPYKFQESKKEMDLFLFTVWKIENGLKKNRMNFQDIKTIAKLLGCQNVPVLVEEWDVSEYQLEDYFTHFLNEQMPLHPSVHVGDKGANSFYVEGIVVRSDIDLNFSFKVLKNHLIDSNNGQQKWKNKKKK